MSRHPNQSFTFNPTRTLALAAGLAILASSAGVVHAQQSDDDKGKARVVERKGPEVEVKANTPGHVLVLFPVMQSGEKNAVEITMVESQMPAAPAPGEQPQGSQQPMPTGKEYVFNSKDARDQTVSYKLDANGMGRKLMLLGKIDGQTVDVRPAGGPEGVQMYLVTMPEKPKPQQEQAQPKEGEQAAPQQPAQPPAPPTQAAIIVVYTGGTGQ